MKRPSYFQDQLSFNTCVKFQYTCSTTHSPHTPPLSLSSSLVDDLAQLVPPPPPAHVVYIPDFFPPSGHQPASVKIHESSLLREMVSLPSFLPDIHLLLPLFSSQEYFWCCASALLLIQMGHRTDSLVWWTR